MRQHRNTMRMGLPIPPPPVSETKLQELLTLILPDAMEPYVKELEARTKGSGAGILPSTYTS
jgi:hypothetical protein